MVIFITFAIHTFGCKVNSYESGYMSQLLIDNGMELSADNTADVHIINSCTVTGYSDKKVRQFLSRLRREQPKSVIILTGCIPQSRVQTDESVDDLCADIILGTKKRSEIYSLLTQFLHERKRIVCVEKYSASRDFEPMMCRKIGKKTRANIKIEDGCDNFCSYCIIPYARGRVRSRPLDDIAQQARIFANSGFKEIVLTGINLSAYGSDIGKNLCDAVSVCCKIEGIERVRLGSLETERLELDILEALSHEKKLCPHFHLSLQSGSNNVLKAMNRKYTAEQYSVLCEKMKELFKNCAITTDIIVGFPNETQNDFENTLEMIEKIGFADVHVFPYSPRTGTKAAKMPQISDFEKTQRAKIAEKWAAQARERFLKSQVGTVHKVLFEHENCEEFHTGYTENYCRVNVHANLREKSLQNKCFCVKIKEYNDFCLIGEIVDEKIN